MLCRQFFKLGLWLVKPTEPLHSSAGYIIELLMHWRIALQQSYPHNQKIQQELTIIIHRITQYSGLYALLGISIMSEVTRFSPHN